MSKRIGPESASVDLFRRGDEPAVEELGLHSLGISGNLEVASPGDLKIMLKGWYSWASWHDDRLTFFGAVPALRSALLSWLPSASTMTGAGGPVFGAITCSKISEAFKMELDECPKLTPAVEVRAKRTGMRLFRAAAGRS